MIYMSIVMIICFCVGCSSFQEKPSEEMMKDLMMSLVLKDHQKVKYSYKFDTFNITNSFFSKSKGSGGESTPYCIEGQFKLSWVFPDKQIGGQVLSGKFSFIKKGNKWYVEQGWR